VEETEGEREGSVKDGILGKHKEKNHIIPTSKAYALMMVTGGLKLRTNKPFIVSLRKLGAKKTAKRISREIWRLLIKGA